MAEPPERSKTTLQEVRSLLPAGSVFGPEEWQAFFPGMVAFPDASPTELAEIPWPSETLSSHPVKAADVRLSDHFLFLGLDALVLAGGRRSVSVFTWPEILRFATPRPPEQRAAGRYPRIHEPEALRARLLEDAATPGPPGWSRPIGAPVVHFSREACALRWHFMPIDSLEGSAGIHDLSQIHQPFEYELAAASEVVTANVLYHLLNGRFMPMVDPVVRTASSLYAGGSVSVWSDAGELAVGIRAPAQGAPGVALSRTPTR